MATFSRSDLITRIRQASDTVSATVDYPDAFLLDIAGMVHIDEWKKIFDEAPYYRTASVAVALDSSKTFAWSALSTGTGNSAKNAYRVLEMTNTRGDNLVYHQPDRLRLADPSRVQTTFRMWTRNGDRVQTFGTTALDTLTVLVNYTPCSVSDLASDADTVDWLNDYKPILWYESASTVLAKAGREVSEAQQLAGLADVMRQKMLSGIRREAATPYVMSADDNPWEWGG